MTMRTALLIGLCAALVGCACGDRTDEPPGTPPTPSPTGSSTPEPATEADGDPQRAEDLALLESLVGAQELGDFGLRVAYDLGTMRMVVIDKPGVPQTVSVVDLLPPPDMTEAQMAGAFDASSDGSSLELLGYDSVAVTERKNVVIGGQSAPWVRTEWSRRDEDTGTVERGQGTVAWIRCAGSDRWVFVSEETPGGEIKAARTAAVLGRFQLCPTE